MSNTYGYGQAQPWDSADDYNAMVFVISQLLARASTMKLVKVQNVTPNADPIKAGTVDVIPLVDQVDGNGNTTPHGTIYGLLYVRIQGGTNAVIVEPKAGDVGLCIVADRDTSAVRASGGGQSAPGSFRQFDLADGVYLGGLFGPAPTQSVQFTDDGIKLSDKNGNVFEMKAGGIDVTTVAFRCNGSIIAGFGTGDQVSVQTHLHTSGGSGSPTSPPTPGS